MAPTYTNEGREHFRAVQVVCGKQHTLGLIANNGRVLSFACGAWCIKPQLQHYTARLYCKTVFVTFLRET